MTTHEDHPANWSAPGDLLLVRVNLPSPLRTMAQYAISALTEPLAIRTEWVSEVPGSERPVLYYGPPEYGTEGEIQLAFDPRGGNVLAGDGRIGSDDLRWMEWGGEMWPVLFADDSGSPDVVASSFYLLAGLDELKSRERDLHDRPRFDDSIQSRAGFADKPVVDVYREWLADLLFSRGIGCARRSWGGHPWAVCPTFDVDYLWKWRKGMIYREVVRNLLLNDRNESSKYRLRRFGQVVADVIKPRDVYRSALSRIIEEVKARDGTATVFLKAGAHGPNDVAYSLRDRWLGRVVASAQAAGFEFGLHPSYYAHTHGGYLSLEAERLAVAIGRQPRSVRQHYLRYRMPVTMDLHEQAGFEIDTTMGFPTHEGFRRSTGVPFRIYNPFTHRVSRMWEMPLIAMDGALFNRRRYSVSEAVDATRRLMDRCRSFGGCAVILWHNVLWDEMDAPGWGHHLLEVLDYAKSEGALISSLETALGSWRDAGAT